MTTRLLSAILLAGLAAGAGPANAQDEDGETVNMVIVYGDDACPESTGSEIVVCARKNESERYRIPENLRYSDNPANTAWTERVERLEMVGKFGTLSCTPVGAGGFTGCAQQMIDKAYADKRGGSAVRFSELIAEARAKRLSTIDEDAAAEQKRVEELERQYMERQKAESEKPVPGEEALPQPEETPQEPGDNPN